MAVVASTAGVHGAIIVAASSAAARHNREIANQHQQQQILSHAALRHKLKSIGVITCTAFYTNIKHGRIYEGCDIGEWNKKYISFNDYIAIYAPGFTIDYFILNSNVNKFEIYLKRKGNE